MDNKHIPMARREPNNTRDSRQGYELAIYEGYYFMQRNGININNSIP